MDKRCPLVMLPTNKKAPIGNNVIILCDNAITNEPLRYGKKVQEAFNISCPEQQLYILSDEKIEEGDWIGYPNLKNWIPVQYLGGDLTGNEKKIIATTDESLKLNWVKVNSAYDFTLEQLSKNIPCLPQIPESFIKYFVSQYNKGNLITEVMVEYILNETGNYREFDATPELNQKLKINPDNTINIKPIKDSWSRREVIELIQKYNSDFKVFQDNEKWIEENL